MQGQPASRDPAPESRAAETLGRLGGDREHGLAEAEAAARLARDGANEVPEPPSRPLLLFARKFWGISAWMIELILALSIYLHKWPNAAVAGALLVVNATLGFLQEQRASAAVAALRGRLQITARVLRGGTWRGAPARELVAGDLVRVRAGDVVPADLQLLQGELSVDQSALTGESRAVDRRRDAILHAGSLIRRGEGTAVVVATGARTYYGRTTELVARARPKLHVEVVIARVVKWLVLIVAVLVAIAIAASLVAGLPLAQMVPLALVLLMSAVPVALPAMFTVTTALGSLELARRGVLVTRLSAAEDAATMDVVCADKTGTLTMNRLRLTGVVPRPGFGADDVVRDGALASQEANQDPIDLAFLAAARERDLVAPGSRIVRFVPVSPASRRTEAIVETSGGRHHVVKGALRSVAEAVGLEPAALQELEAVADEEAERGARVLAVARGEEGGPLQLVGLALLSDPLRADSRQLVDELGGLGVAVKMLTGDALPIARRIARDLGLGEIVRAPELRSAHTRAAPRADELVREADGVAEVFPEDKFLVVESLQHAGRVVGMTGDGVNDAPALRQAEVGIAVDGATDIAKGAASVVLTSEGLAGIVDLVRIGRAIYQRVLTWIINKVGQTILVAGYVVIALLATRRFVVSALVMVLLIFMTDFVKIALSTDRVRPSVRPETWRIGPLISVAVVLGVLMLVEALGLLVLGWRWFDLGSSDGRHLTFAFESLLFFALFSIISIRERRAFWRSRPSKVLAAALLADAVAGAAIGAHGLGVLAPLAPSTSALIVVYALVCSLGINDLVKSALIARAVPQPRRDQPPSSSAGVRAGGGSSGGGVSGAASDGGAGSAGGSPSELGGFLAGGSAGSALSSRTETS
jgi:H+-transporting ATPase